jgi:hypothetical protein
VRNPIARIERTAARVPCVLGETRGTEIRSARARRVVAFKISRETLQSLEKPKSISVHARSATT